jgi:3-hydroxypropanoate dehydrogenase
LFRNARTFNAWLPKEVSDEQLHAAVRPGQVRPDQRQFFADARGVREVEGRQGKAGKPFLSEGNRAKTLAAPVTAIIANDHEFYEKLPKLFPHADARSWFVGNQVDDRHHGIPQCDLAGRLRDAGGARDGAGLRTDVRLRQCRRGCGFFAGTPIKSNFLINIGYGDASRDLFPAQSSSFVRRSLRDCLSCPRLPKGSTFCIPLIID